jgi:hypothetical protein
VATISPCSWGCLRSEPHPGYPGVTENQHDRIVYRGTKGSNPLSSSGESSANLTSSIRAPKIAKRDDATRLNASGTLSHCVSDIAVPHDPRKR